MNDLQRAKRIVFKVGTSTLTHDTGKLNLRRMRDLARVLSDLKTPGGKSYWCPQVRLAWA